MLPTCRRLVLAEENCISGLLKGVGSNSCRRDQSLKFKGHGLLSRDENRFTAKQAAIASW